MTTEKIIYPEKFKPENCPVFVRNEIEINAAPEKVWFRLTDAATWHEWYFNASNVEFLNQKDGHLKADTKFKWRTFGANLNTEIAEFVPNERIAWRATGLGIEAYHAWLITPTEKGCRVLTEETQHGWLCRLGKLLMPNRMFRYHQIWLEGLKKKAEQD
jgi:uncharacterized protein YndB with AHSA1/START domain